MKKIIISLLVLGALGGAGYYFTTDAATSATDASPVKAASNVAQPPVVKPSAAPVPAKVVVEAPKPTAAPVVVKTVTSAAPNPVAAAPAPASPRAELATLLPELTRLIDIQDYETLMQDFVPPEELNALLASVGRPGQPMALGELVGHMRQDPAMAQKMAGAAQFLTFLQSQTPTMDPSGESASYKMPRPFKGQDSIHFVKIDGNWYVKDSVPFFR